ncbi:MAG TPA: hypothetical protein DCX82_07615 [Lachnospiraceae bacterium]|nr:hypothetical protein [Lachnospiraceae bacterium]
MFKYLNPKNLKGEIKGYGYTFTPGDFLKYIVLVYGGIVAFSYLFKLKIPYIIFIAAAVTLLLPDIFLNQFRNMYEEKRFEDITAYMEQLLYSFKRRAKILSALQDTLTLFYDEHSKSQGGLYEAIQKAIDHIQTSETEGNIYEEAFSYIEKEYGCKRLYKIHDFLIRVEAAGGECSNAVEILLDDRKLWMDRVYTLQKDKANVKVKITIGIALSFLICAMGIYMLPPDFHVINNPLSQGITTLVIITNVLIWYASQKKLSGSLLVSGNETPFKEIQKRYEYVMHVDLKQKRKKALITAAAFSPLILLAYWKVNITSAAFMAVFCWLIASQPKRHYKTSLKIITKEVEKAFPEWLMSLALQLQTDNVHVSISKTIGTAQEVLQEELQKLLDGIEQRPNSLQPYTNFFRKIQLPDITSAMKMLYSMAEFGAADVEKQIGALVQRNTVLMDKAERIRQEDSLSGISFLILLPMLTGVIKLIVDLGLVVMSILSTINTI